MNNKSEQLNELFSALAKAQGEMDTAKMSSLNPFFKNKYASFLDIVKASRPYLSKHGLCISQQILVDDHGNSYLQTLMGHSSGQFIESRIRINPGKTDIQSFGSYLSYLKRYSYASIVGVIADDLEDDDAESHMQHHRQQPPRR